MLPCVFPFILPFYPLLVLFLTLAIITPSFLLLYTDIHHAITESGSEARTCLIDCQLAIKYITSVVITKHVRASDPNSLSPLSLSSSSPSSSTMALLTPAVSSPIVVHPALTIFLLFPTHALAPPLSSPYPSPPPKLSVSVSPPPSLTLPSPTHSPTSPALSPPLSAQPLLSPRRRAHAL